MSITIKNKILNITDNYCNIYFLNILFFHDRSASNLISNFYDYHCSNDENIQKFASANQQELFGMFKTLLGEENLAPNIYSKFVSLLIASSKYIITNEETYFKFFEMLLENNSIFNKYFDLILKSFLEFTTILPKDRSFLYSQLVLNANYSEDDEDDGFIENIMSNMILFDRFVANDQKLVREVFSSQFESIFDLLQRFSSHVTCIKLRMLAINNLITVLKLLPDNQCDWALQHCSFYIKSAFYMHKKLADLNRTTNCEVSATSLIVNTFKNSV